MLDENLPTFYTKPSSDNPLSSTIFLSQNGSELQPEYTLRRPNPELAASKNCYAVALYDSYNPDVLYAEVLVRPEWTQPTLSAAEIRAQNGVPPPPVPIVPINFTVQLYNPDQQVVIRQIPGSWNSSAHWEFEMPQNSFRIPSASALDRSQSDPAASDITPKVAFAWRRDGKLSKDISCYLVGRSTEGKKNKEPDIPIAMLKAGKNLTIYEPNMHRVEVEDVKGLEVVLLLGALVVKDIYFNANREMFNINSPNTTSPNQKRKNSGPVIAGTTKVNVSPPLMSGAVLTGQSARPHNIPSSQIPPPQPPRNTRHTHSTSLPPPPDPRIQWEIDAETERLKKIVEAEERAREKADREEQKRIKKMLEAEEKERKRRDAEVAKETERLRKQYGVPAIQQPPLPNRPQQQQWQSFPQQYSAPHSQPVPVQRPQSAGWFNTGPARPSPQQNYSPYLNAPGPSNTASSSGFFGLGGRNKMQKKKSVFF